MRALILILTALFLTASSLAQVSRTYTLDADFDEGILINVNHNAPNNNQLQLNATTSGFPFINVAASGRGTVVRIDVNTGQILGEYLTAPNGRFRNPSRTTVDLFGNVWVANRDEDGISGGVPKGSICRIGLIIGGTRVNADGTPNPVGEYLAPPFIYNTCIDRDGDGLIKTSLGLGDIRPWLNPGGIDDHGGVTSAEDEAIINYVRVTGTGTRTVAIDANNDVWVGGLNNTEHEKVDGVTGMPVTGTQFNLGCGGYGGLLDGNGVLWSSRGGGSLLRFDTNTMTGVCIGYPDNYGLGIDPNTGEIWSTDLSGNVIHKLAPDGTLLGTFSHGSFYAQGVAVDGSGNVWVAHSLFSATTVGHLRTDGTYVGNVTLPGGNGPTGVAIDANGKVWVTNINTNNAMRIDPTAGPIGGGGFPIGAVDLTVDLGPGASPYNYSDMTGFVSIGTTAPQGTWTVVFDGGSSGIDWGTASWNSLEPQGTSVKVEVRASDNPAVFPPFVQVFNGVSFNGSGVTGRYIEIRTTLSRQPSVQISPILYDLTISSGPLVVDDTPPNCNIVLVPNSSPKAIDITLTDPESGVASVKVIKLSNAKLEIPFGSGMFYIQGQTATISPAQLSLLARATKINNSKSSTITIKATDAAGNSVTCDPVYSTIADLVPGEFELQQNYPNPFNPSTTIRFSVAPGNGEAEMVTLKIYDLTGQEVKTLIREPVVPGMYAVEWNATDNHGQQVAGGVYLYRMVVGNFVETRKMVLIK